ncbi:hypothetical protein HYALB_00005114 [Hymenoscyphus albidus]|uniref:Uncharacterized protein n=1 Tax=Hymenoscyphus albidus TaxID=595503 RepID=A0A9N9QAQ1_9HELO|nr:hypothetical protein HYALB_00005114 [Hymenoscyphus albidus]
MPVGFETPVKQRSAIVFHLRILLSGIRSEIAILHLQAGSKDNIRELCSAKPKSILMGFRADSGQ